MDPEQHKNLLLQQLMRQQQAGNPLMQQQMLGGGFSGAGGQMFGQNPGQLNQNQPGASQSQHGQPQPGGQAAGGLGGLAQFQHQIGGSFNPLLHHQNPQASLLQQQQALQAAREGAQGQTGAHQIANAAQLAAAQRQQTHAPTGLMAGGQNPQGIGQHLLGQNQGGILGQIGSQVGTGAQGPSGQGSLINGIFVPGGLQQQPGQQSQGFGQASGSGAQGQTHNQLGQLQQHQLQQHHGQGQLGGAGGPSGPNQIAQYLKQYQEQQQQLQQQQNQAAQQSHTENQQQKPPHQHLQNQQIPSGLQGGGSFFNQNEQQQQQQAQPQSNVHHLNLLGHLGQQNAGAQGNLQSVVGGLSASQVQQLLAQNQGGNQSVQQHLAQQISQQQQAQQQQQQQRPGQQTPLTPQGGMLQQPKPQIGQTQPNQQQTPLTPNQQHHFNQQQQTPLAGLTNANLQNLNAQPSSNLQQLLQNNPQLQAQLGRPQQQQQQLGQNQQMHAGSHLVGTGIAGSVMTAETNTALRELNQTVGQQQQQTNQNLGQTQSQTQQNPTQNQQQTPANPQNANQSNLMNVSNLNKLAEYCATNGEYQHAIEYYLQLTNLDPENGPAWTALGHCYLLVEDLQKSFNAYQHALYSLDDIKDPQLWYGIGILYEKFESYDHAISALIAVLKMSPNFYQKSEVLYKLGIIFAKTNQIEQAISYFQNSILTNTFTVKRRVDTLLKIGLLYEEAKDYVQAQRSYEAALSHDENNYKIYQHLAHAYFLQGNINSAIEFVRKAEKKNKAQSDSFFILGRCFMALENNKEALENFQQAAYKNPGEAVYWATLAIFYYNTGNYTDAFENIIKATTLNPQMAEVWYNLGVLYEKCRQPEEALIAYTKVLELDNEDPDATRRIMAIKNPFYQQEQQKNQVTLQMKYPKFSLPNSLMILRKYKKQNANQTKQGLDTNSPGTTLPAAPGGTGAAGAASGILQQTLQMGNNQLPTAGGQQQSSSSLGNQAANLGQRMNQAEENANAQGFNQLQQLMGAQAKSPNLQQQQQFQGQQDQQNQPGGVMPSQLAGLLGNPQQLQMKLQGGGGLGALGAFNPNANPSESLNKLNDIHQILKSGGANPQLTSQSQGSGNFGQGASTTDNQLQSQQFNQQQTNQGIQQQSNQFPSQLFNQNQQVTQGQSPAQPVFNQQQQQQLPNFPTPLGESAQSNTEAAVPQQQQAVPQINMQKTNINQILQSLPADISNLGNLTRDQLIMLLQQQTQQQPQQQAAPPQQPQQEEEEQKQEKHEETPAPQSEEQVQQNFNQGLVGGVQGNNGMQFNPAAAAFFNQAQLLAQQQQQLQEHLQLQQLQNQLASQGAGFNPSPQHLAEQQHQQTEAHQEHVSENVQTEAQNDPQQQQQQNLSEQRASEGGAGDATQTENNNDTANQQQA